MNQQHVIQYANDSSEGKQMGNIVDIKLDHDRPPFFRLPPRQHEICVFRYVYVIKRVKFQVMIPVFCVVLK